MSAPLPTLAPTFNSSDDNDLSHIVCDCSPHIALCGCDQSDVDYATGDVADELRCIVCDELEWLPCDRCGS